MPLVEDRFQPNAQDFDLLAGGSLSTLLLEPVPLRPTPPENVFSVVPLSPGLHLLVQRKEETQSHPTEILALTLDMLRDGHLLKDARAAGLELDGLSGLSVPGQAHGTSGMRSESVPSEGVVMVVSDSDDWARPVQPDATSLADVLPALKKLWSDDTVSWSKPNRESVVTSDFRGLLLDAEEYEIHDDVSLAEEETIASLMNLAHGHALRSYDVAAAARLADRLLLGLGRAETVERKPLEAMRQVQLRFASRGLEAVIEHREWEGTNADDAFRVRQRLRLINASLDSTLNRAFERFQPLVEASEAARIQEQSDSKAEERRRKEEQTRAAEARADEERRIRLAQDAARQERAAKLTRRGAGAVAGASVLVLFAALAAIPKGRTFFSPYVRAAFATVVLGAVVAGTAWLMERAMHARAPRGWLRWLVGATGWGLILAALGAAAVGWLGEGDPGIGALLGVVAALVAGGCLALLVVDLDTPRGGQER